MTIVMPPFVCAELVTRNSERHGPLSPAAAIFATRKGFVMTIERFWGPIVAVAILIVSVAGGISIFVPWRLWLISVVSVAILIPAAYRLGTGLPSRLAVFGLLIILAMVALLGVQLIPLPVAMWSNLPFRQFVFDGISATGLSPGSMPMTLSRLGTLGELVAVLPGIAFFLAALTVDPRQRWWIAAAFIVFVMADVFVALAEHSGVIGTLYGDANRGSVGMFPNRNFYAASLYTALPVMVALALTALRSAKSRLVVGAVAAVCLLLVIIGLGAAGSRAGVVLAMVAIFASAALPFVRHEKPEGWGHSWAIGAGVVAGLFLMGQFGLLAIVRLIKNDTVADYRTDIATISLRTMKAFFPTGSGFGTFVPVYQLFETPATVREVIANHAHNDWLELLIEGGIPAGILLTAFAIWYLTGFYRVWTSGRSTLGDLLPRAMAISGLLLLLHSLVDYPLRTPAMMVFLAVACAFMAGSHAPVPERRRRQAREPNAPVTSQSRKTAVQMRQPTQGFARRNDERVP